MKDNYSPRAVIGINPMSVVLGSILSREQRVMLMPLDKSISLKYGDELDTTPSPYALH